MKAEPHKNKNKSQRYVKSNFKNFITKDMNEKHNKKDKIEGHHD
jgi:hypothetical protein